ncbi:hypothetical protein VNO77_24153 [Canavalia gladiata]|uniref:Uncharacterized protein n=1 Tax=Canavalia gladiata TaxID=3824 RepID=A0AAN9L5R1_CANGL
MALYTDYAVDRFGLEHFHVAFYMDPTTIALLWQMAVIPFGLEIPLLISSIKVKDKEAVTLKVWCTEFQAVYGLFLTHPVALQPLDNRK